MMKEIRPFVISTIILALGYASVAYAAPYFRQEADLVPITDSVHYLGTTTGATKAWLQVISDSFYDTDASDGCATFSSNVLTSTGSACGSGSGGTPFAWTVQSWGVSTSTTLGFLQGFLSSASSTINASTTITGVLTASGGIYGNLTGLASLATALNANGSNCSAGSFPLGVDASGASESCTDAWTEAENTSAAYISLGSLSATWPIDYSSGAFSWVGLATTTNPTAGNLLYSNGTNGLVPVATSSVTFNSPITTSGTPGYVVGGSSWVVDVDDIGAADLASADFGEFTCNGTTCSLDDNTTVTGWTLGNFTGTNATFTNATTTSGFFSNLLHGLSLRIGETATTTIDAEGDIALPAAGTFTIDSELFDSLTDDPTLANNGGDLQVVDVTCTNCLTTTEVASADLATLATNVSDTDFGEITVSSGTWTVDDSLAVTSWNLTTPTLTSFFGTACTGNNFLQDIGDTGTFSCGAASGSDSFTHTSYGGFTTSATTSLIHLTNSLGLAATSTFANYASSTILSIGAYGATPKIYFSEDGDGALTIQGIGNSANESLTFNFDDTSNEVTVSSGTGVATTTFSMGVQANALQIDTNTTGVRFDTDGDGSLIISGTANGSDEDLTINLDDTSNQIDFTSGSGVTSLDFNTLAIHGALGAVGTPGFAFTGDVNTGMWSPGAELLSFSTNGVERARFTGYGNLGIGTSTPRWALQVASSTGAQFTISDSGALTSNHWSLRNAGGILYFATSSPTTYATGTNAMFTLNSTTGTTTISSGLAATSSAYFYSTVSGRGGSVILEDVDGAGCTEIYTLNGTVSGRIVTCPTEI